VSPVWTTPDDVRVLARKRWDSGEWLSCYLSGEPWEPFRIAVRGPRPADIGERLADVQEWARQWSSAADGPLRVEYKQVGGRHFGTNTIPNRAWLDSYDDAWALLRTGGQVRRVSLLLSAASDAGVGSWVIRYPLKALSLADEWDRLLAVVDWIDSRQVPGMFVREVDVPDVDTKFIDAHRGVLAGLLDVRLAPSRVRTDATSFAERYGFARKPAYVRFRFPFQGFSEMSVRVEEFVSAPSGAGRVYVIENEVTYLAFPAPSDALVIFGGGYAVGTLAPLTWLADLAVTYWGDLDTHGFAILNGLRGHFPHVRSMLMDSRTLLDHRTQWVVEPSPTSAVLPYLTAQESAVYVDLVADLYGPRVRLEQERVRFSSIRAAIDSEPVEALDL
jgi:hypothetical protein